MLVRDVMNRRVMTIREDEPLSLAVQMMLWAGVRHLPVMRAGKLVGLVSERDILRYRADPPAAHPLERPVSEAMVATVTWADPEEDLTEAVARFADSKADCLPVLSKGDLVGILSIIDVLAHQVRIALGEGAKIGPLAQDLMTLEPLTVRADDYLLDAAARMSQAGIRHLPVIGGDGKLQGMLGDREVRLAVGNPQRFLDEKATRVKIQSMRVQDAMIREPLKVNPDSPMSLLLTAFTDWRIGAVPVVDGDDRLQGIISYVDVLRVLRERMG